MRNLCVCMSLKWSHDVFFLFFFVVQKMPQNSEIQLNTFYSIKTHKRGIFNCVMCHHTSNRKMKANLPR